MELPDLFESEPSPPTPPPEVLDKVADRNGGPVGFKAARPQKILPPPPVISDRLPPHSIEMEMGVLSCILQDPMPCLSECMDYLKDGAISFYDLRHQEIYSAAISMSDAKAAIDIITLQQHLKDLGLLDQIGGISYLSKLQETAPSAANLRYYLDIVSDKWTLRKVVQKCTEVVGRIYDYEGEIDGVLDEVERSFSGITRAETNVTLDGKLCGDKMFNDLERRLELGGKLSGLDTGLRDLNRICEGLQFGEQAVIGARPSMGKTALGLGIFQHCSFNQVPSLFISLEMSVEAVMRRLLSAYMKIPLKDIRRGNYLDGHIQKFAVFRDHAKRSQMHVIDAVDGLTIRQLCSRVRRHVLKHGIKLVVIDYLQKIRPSERHEKKTYEIGEISGRLKALAVETGVAMLTLAQLNRENVNQKGRAPRLSDLADSGQIERDADLVGLIHREENQTSLIIAKQRDGETGIVPLFFDGTYCRFENAAFD